MPTKALTDSEIIKIMEEVKSRHGNVVETARETGITRNRINHARREGIVRGLYSNDDIGMWRKGEFQDEKDPKDTKIFGLEEKLREHKQELAELKRANVSQDAVLAVIGNAKDQLQRKGDTEWLTWKPNKKTDATPGIANLMLSDWHYGEVVRPEEMRGVNAYNTEIAARRIQTTFRMAVELLKYHSTGTYQGIVVYLLGDLLNGIIHDELKDSASTSVTRDLIDLVPLLVSGLTMLAEEFGKVHALCLCGNHGRIDYKKRFKGRQEQNFEWVLYQFLKIHLADDDRITIEIPESFDAEMEVFDVRFMATHGDRFQGGGGIGGIWPPLMRGTARTQQREAAFDSRVDYMLMGHWHQLVYGNQFIVNGALKGYDEYAMGYGFPPQTPRQALFVIHDKKGITSERKILADGTDRMIRGKGWEHYLKAVREAA